MRDWLTFFWIISSGCGIVTSNLLLRSVLRLVLQFYQIELQNVRRSKYKRSGKIKQLSGQFHIWLNLNMFTFHYYKYEKSTRKELSFFVTLKRCLSLRVTSLIFARRRIPFCSWVPGFDCQRIIDRCNGAESLGVLKRDACSKFDSQFQHVALETTKWKFPLPNRDHRRIAQATRRRC